MRSTVENYLLGTTFRFDSFGVLSYELLIDSSFTSLPSNLLGSRTRNPLGGRFNPKVIVTRIVGRGHPWASPRPIPTIVIWKVSYEENGPPVGVRIDNLGTGPQASTPFVQI